MLIDNLHKINSQGDLFKYICETESKLEEAENTIKAKNDRISLLKNQLKAFLAREKWFDVSFLTPRPGNHIEAYLEKEDGSYAFAEVSFEHTSGWHIDSMYADYSVLYWRYLT